jgi:8-amino-7-oxononanoate synthase
MYNPVVHHRTFVELLRRRALDQPDRLAYTFLVDGDSEEIQITYGELDRQARAIAATLQELNTERQRTLLLYPPGLDYIAAFFGCLYAGVIAVPVYPPDPARLDRTLPRLRAIAKDAEAKFALTTQTILSMTDLIFEQIPDFRSLHWIATDNLDGNPAGSWIEPKVSEEEIAFLQYTSGSTGSPRGVMVSHRNLLHNLSLIQQCFQNTPESRGVIWLPPYHDMGLIGGPLEPLYGDHPVVLFSPIDFLTRPLRWLQAISRYRATHSGGPNFAYDLCVRKVTPDERDRLDLRSWEVAFCGAEPIRTETLERFADYFAPCGFRREAFYPCYGLAEGTLIVSGGKKEDPPIIKTLDNGKNLVGCGRSLEDQRIVIADPETLRSCGPGETGEIWVSGPSVAKGYWKKPKETEETFRAFLKESGEGPFLRTGDLGFLKDGELFVTGRLKDLIIIRGQNHYPHDIERTVEQSDFRLRPGCGAAFSLDGEGEERLVIVQEVDTREPRNTEEIIDRIRRAVYEVHDLKADAVVLIEPRSIPKTSSGKIQRNACRIAFQTGRLDIVGKWEPIRSQFPVGSEDPQQGGEPTVESIQNWIVAWLARELGIDAGAIDSRKDFTNYGLDSMMAVRFAQELQDQLGRKMEANLLLNFPTIEALSRHLAGLRTVPAATDRAANPAAPVWSRRIVRFDESPEFRAFHERLGQAGGLNPFNVPMDSVVKDTSLMEGREVLNFSGYNYLGLSGHPKTMQAAQEAIRKYGTSASGSRLVTGEKSLYRELERELSRWKETDDALVLVSGHATNVTFIGNFCNEKDLIVCDALSHDSIYQGCRLSRSASKIFRHSDFEDLESLLKRDRDKYEKVLIVVEGVYSVDGDICPVPEFVRLKRRYGCFLMVDEAHSSGVLGKTGAGVHEHFGLSSGDVDIYMGTLSKALGACGGYLAGERGLIDYWRYNLPGFAFSVGISPPVAAAALAAIRLIRSDPSLIERLHGNCEFFFKEATKRNLNICLAGQSAIFPILVGGDKEAIMISARLKEKGIFVSPAVYPMVPRGKARLRFFVTSEHKEEQIIQALDTLEEVMEERFESKGDLDRASVSRAD